MALSSGKLPRVECGGDTARRGEVDISVVLCTFNRCRSLRKTLDSLVAQVLPHDVNWEVVVVDNNSSDETQTVVESESCKYPGRFRYVFEGDQGLSRARNKGILSSKGKVIAFIDDDVVAEPDWLRNLTAAFCDGKWAGSGGRILAPPDFCSPRWLTLKGEFDLGGALALFDLGDQPGELPRPPYGTNMAFRRSMFQKYGMFRVDLGRCGQGLLSGEDTEFGRRLIMANEHLRYEPSAVVYHPVPPERLNASHFRRWWFDYGRTRVIERDPRAAVLGIPREFISIVNLTWYFLPLRAFQWLISVDRRRRFYYKCQLWMNLGEWVQNCRKARASGVMQPQL